MQISLPGVDQTTEGDSTVIDQAVSVADEVDSTVPPVGENTNQNARSTLSDDMEAASGDLPSVEINVEEAGEGAVMSHQRRPSGFEIVIGLEDECGAQKPVEIDETDDGLKEPEEEEKPKTPGKTLTDIQFLYIMTYCSTFIFTFNLYLM